MKLNVKTPRDFINPLLSRKTIDADSFQHFKLVLQQYLQDLTDQISRKQSEPNIVTNALKPFIDELGYDSSAHSQIGQSGIDLAVMQNNQPAVILEAKMPNSRDMITIQDLNKKALHEAVLYFMRERARGNTRLFYIIITDFYNWFVFDAKDFDRLFWRNPAIKRLFDAHTSRSQLGDTTAEFYKALETELPKQKGDSAERESLDCAYFNLQAEHSEKQRIAIYKLLSANCLLKAFNPNDANSLNLGFYKELLYILGLEESKEKGKKVIGPAKTTQNGTLYENIRNKLSQYQKADDFESVLKLTIIWVNRILFLKLLESQIVKWTKSAQSKFLHPDKITQYDQMETLFFEILAKPTTQRNTHEFDQVPYLNSSLFQIYEDEKAGITIAALTDDLEIEYFNKTVVKDAGSMRRTGKVSTLPYLLEFLDTYDFANDSDNEVVVSTKALISASVLGLIFEKINGYKEGSFYTPSFITMYMAQETLEKTVVRKFNIANQWHCKTLRDIYNKDPDIAEANQIINSIKVCDPAVGSGHFLVSILNEMLRIKSELRVLVDEEGKRIRDYTLCIENDELIIKDDEGEIFEYERGNIEKTRIQKTLFQEKQILIENCLFGVDINPNSVNICRLRLWIELLKNAYYQDNGMLDTLPNIDINIQCGNSLISRFDLNSNLKSKTISKEIKEYKTKIREYKENIGSKQAVAAVIRAIKEKLRDNLQGSHAATMSLNRKLTVYVKEYGIDELDDRLQMRAFKLKLLGQQGDMFGGTVNEPLQKKRRKELDKALLTVFEIESGKVYKNAFEWRYEFPEVLNDDGDYIGFDIVIGNPPYIYRNLDADLQKKYYKVNYLSAEGNYDLYKFFIERINNLVVQSGIGSYIVSNSFFSAKTHSKLRDFMMDNYEMNCIHDLGLNVFDGVTVENTVFFLTKEKMPKNNLSIVKIDYRREKKINRPEQHYEIDLRRIYEKENTFNIHLNQTVEKLIDKIRLDTIPLANITYCTVGINTGYIKDELVADSHVDHTYHKMLSGRDISPYCISWKGEWIKYDKEFVDGFGNRGRTLPPEDIFSDEKILVQRTRRGLKRKLVCAYDNGIYYNLNRLSNVVMTSNEYRILYLLALLNSKLLDYYFNVVFREYEVKPYHLKQIPIKIIDKSEQKPFVEMAKSILSNRRNNKDASAQEFEMDKIVYDLYRLNEDEIELIEQG